MNRPDKYLEFLQKISFLIKKNCPDLSSPVVRYEGSWVHQTSPDQKRIESFLNQFGLQGKGLLHVGVGSSSIARKFFSRLEYLDGITLVDEEKKYAESLNLFNYHVYIINKYSETLLSLKKRYDIIIDNNLSSYACCLSHFKKMVENYIELLHPGGFIVTDREGLKYFTSGFGMTYEDLIALGNIFPVMIEKIDEYVFTITKIDNAP
jgi:hypothetical protein